MGTAQRRRTLVCVTHMFGDADSWGSTWLARRFLIPAVAPGAREVWTFVPFNSRGWPDGSSSYETVLRRAFAVFDVGNVFDPARLRFDHHGLVDASGKPTPRANSATRQVWEHLCAISDAGGLGMDLAYLEPLVDLVHAGDTGQLDACGWGMSSSLGLHAILGGMRAKAEEQVLRELGWREEAGGTVDEHAMLQKVDLRAMHQAHLIFDGLAASCRRGFDVAANLDRWVVYRSADSKVWGLQGAPYGAVAEAHKRGAKLVIATSERRLPTSTQVEIWAERRAGINVRELLRAVKIHAATAGERLDIADEIERLHIEDGFAVRGTPKAPDPSPLAFDIRDLCAMVDAWLDRLHMVLSQW